MTDIVDRLRLFASAMKDASTAIIDDNALRRADEIERLREALAFYAEWGIDAPAVDAIIEEDRGDKARAALNIVLGEEE